MSKVIEDITYVLTEKDLRVQLHRFGLRATANRLKKLRQSLVEDWGDDSQEIFESTIQYLFLPKED